MQAIDLRYTINDEQLLKSRLTKLGIDYSNLVSTNWLGNSIGLVWHKNPMTNDEYVIPFFGTCNSIHDIV